MSTLLIRASAKTESGTFQRSKAKTKSPGINGFDMHPTGQLAGVADFSEPARAAHRVPFPTDGAVLQLNLQDVPAQKRVSLVGVRARARASALGLCEPAARHAGLDSGGRYRLGRWRASGHALLARCVGHRYVSQRGHSGDGDRSAGKQR